MRSIALVALLLAACSAEPLPSFPDVDAGAEPFADAGTEIVSDSGGGLSSDSAIVAQDAGSIPDAGTAPDSAIAPELDAGTAPADAGTPVVREDARPPAADAGAPPSPDAGPPVGSCVPDAFEANDGPSSAMPVASGTGWPVTRYAMTWHVGDSADWVRADLDSTGVVGLFRVHAWEEVDARSPLEVRVTCLAGLVVCRGSSATRSGSTCVGRRDGDAFVDVACNTAAPAAVDVEVGVERGASECEHELAVILEPAGA